MVKICRLLAPKVLEASTSTRSILDTPKTMLVSNGKNIPTNTTNVAPCMYPNRRMNIGAHAIGAIGLSTSIQGLVNSLIVLKFPRIRPKGKAIAKANKNPLRNFVRLDEM